MGWTPDQVTSTVLATLSFSSLVGTALIAFFEYFRSQYSDIYLPRVRTDGHRTLDPPPRGPFRWIAHLIRINDEDFFKSVGLDGFIFLRYIRMCCKVTGICAAVGLLILAPIYSSCPGNDGVAGVNLYTMANVEQNGNALWAPFVLTWLFTVTLLYFLHEEYGAISSLRQGFFEHGDPMNQKPQTSYSVLVENVPVEYRSTERLREFFENLFPDQVAHACISVGMHPLARAIEKRDAAIKEMEFAVASREASDTKERPVVRLYKGIPVHSVCNCGAVTEEDAIAYYEMIISALNTKISKYQLEARNAENDDVLPPGTIVSDDDINAANDEQTESQMHNFMPVKAISKKSVSGTGFVTFKSRRAQATACQVAVLSQKYPQLKVFSAPDPDDIIWSNVTTSKKYTDETVSAISIVYSIGILFWGVILAFIATVSNLDALSEYLPFIDAMDPTLYSIVAGLLPVYALVLLIFLIPNIMDWVGKYIEKKKTKSSIEFEVFSWNFTYQLTNVYFLIVAGSFASAISDLIDDPSSAMTTLGSSLPAISVLFINYALNVTLIQIPADMIRLPVMFLFLFYKDVLKEKSLTRRQLVNGPLEDEHLDYGVVLPQLMYLMVLTINYWTISPILIGVLVFTFCGQYLRFKYKLLYIYVPRYESGGYFWYGLYKYTMYALVASTVTMIAYMGIKEGPTQAALLLPLLYVIFKAWKFAEFHHKDVSMFVAYSSAVEADCKTYASPDAATKLYESFHADYYKQPYFSAAQIAVVQPYRIDGTPLFTNNGNLDSVYYKEIANSAQIGSGAHSHLQSAAHAGYRPPSYVASSVHRHTINQMAQPSSDEFIKVGGTRIDEHEL